MDSTMMTDDRIEGVLVDDELDVMRDAWAVLLRLNGRARARAADYLRERAGDYNYDDGIPM